MPDRSRQVGNLPIRIAAGILVLACLAVGAIGLVLPLIPGLLFLGVAAVLAARHFPSISERLNRNGTLRRHLDSVDGLPDLEVREKARLVALIGIRLIADGILSLRDAVAGLVNGRRRASR